MAERLVSGQKHTVAAVEWLPEAIADFHRLYEFLLDKDSNAAAHAASCILQGITLLKSTPRIGRPRADGIDSRELFVAFGAGAYVLRYVLENDSTVIVIRVWHSRENRS